jgi:hypothetical protein
MSKGEKEILRGVYPEAKGEVFTWFRMTEGEELRMTKRESNGGAE